MTSTVEYGQVMDAVPVSPDAAPVGSDDSAGSGKFTVRLHNFTGPFDLLLQLIGKHKLDVTEVALHKEIARMREILELVRDPRLDLRNHEPRP